MAMQVTMGAQMMCSFGLAPSVLVVLPVNRTLSGGEHHRPQAGR